MKPSPIVAFELRPILACLAAFFLLGFAPQEGTADPAADPAAEEEAERVLTVGIAERPPFARKQDDGTWQGLAVNVWRTTAETYGYGYRFEEVAEDRLIDGVASGRFDVALPVRPTAGDADRADFSFPYFTATLGVAETRSNMLLKTTMNLLSWQFLYIVLSLSVLLLIVGAIIWAIERRRNDEQFSREPVKGLGDGFWWAGVTLTTIGYGDKAPATFFGRAVAMLWMLVGLAVSSVLTASVIAAMDLSGGDGALSDVGDKSIGVVAGTGSEEYLRAQGYDPEGYRSAEEGLQALKDGDVDLFVHPLPNLRVVAEEGNFNMRISPTQEDPVLVTFALPKGSEIADEIDAAIIRKVRSPDWWSQVETMIPDAGTKG